jgi:hypothetical protein
MPRAQYQRILYVVTLYLLVCGSQSGLATEWETTVAAAKKEGKVVVSFPASAELRKRVKKAFEKGDRRPCGGLLTSTRPACIISISTLAGHLR